MHRKVMVNEQRATRAVYMYLNFKEAIPNSASMYGIIVWLYVLCVTNILDGSVFRIILSKYSYFV